MDRSHTKKRTIAATTLMVVIVGGVAATAVAQSQRFPDVPPEHQAYAAIEWAADAGVTTGYNDGTFKPKRPLHKRHAVVFMERYYDLILQANESADFTRSDMMRVLHEIAQGTADDEPADTSGLLTDPYEGTPALPITSIWGVRIGGLSGGVQGTGAWFKFQSVSSHSDRDLSKWPVRGWMTLTCSTDPNQPGSSDWFVTFNIQGDASLPVHFEGVNVSLDDGPVGGLATTAHGHMTRRTWAVADSKADDFVAWIAAGGSLSVTTRYVGEGVTFDVSEIRLYLDFVPERCRW